MWGLACLPDEDRLSRKIEKKGPMDTSKERHLNILRLETKNKVKSCVGEEGERKSLAVRLLNQHLDKQEKDRD